MFDLAEVRSRFPALSRKVGGQPAIFFDGPAGSQVPESVALAVRDALLDANANCGGPFATSQESDAALLAARQAATDFLQTDDAQEIVFGPNMTSLTFAVSRALEKTWMPGDEIIVSSLDHDANVTPWVQAAERAGATVHLIRVDVEDCTLDQNHYRSLLSERTRLVAVGAASNATGTINPLKEMFAAAHEVGALTFADAVHLAPHRRLHPQDWGCDFLVCSAYKFFGPHVGIFWGRRELLEDLQPSKLRPAPNSLPGKWMTGTQNHEGIAGVKAAIDYLAGLGDAGSGAGRREQLDSAFERIATYEQTLSVHLLNGLKSLPDYRVWGITDPGRMRDRVPTVSITHKEVSARHLAEKLGRAGIFCWGGNHYAFPWTSAVGLEPEGTLRLGMLHYNTFAEIDRCLECLSAV